MTTSDIPAASTTVRALALLAVFAAAGCSGVGATLLTTSAGAVAGAGVNYSLNGVAYKTFTAPGEEVHQAALATFRHMRMDVREDRATEAGYELEVTASDRTISVEIERITPVVSRVRVGVDQGGLFKDRATATEIVVQFADAVEHEARLRRARMEARR